jgi:phosphoenolpyruvate carboxylase
MQHEGQRGVLGNRTEGLHTPFRVEVSMNNRELLNELHGIDMALVESKEKYQSRKELYDFKAKQILKLRNSYQRSFEEMQELNRIKMLTYPLSLSFTSTGGESFPSFDMVQNKLTALFQTIKKLGTNVGNLFLADFSYGSTILCLDFKKDSSKDIDTIDDFMKIAGASANNSYSPETRQSLKVSQLDEYKFFSSALNITPSSRSHIESIGIGSAIVPATEKVNLEVDTRKIITEYISDRQTELPEVVEGYIMEIDEHYKSFQLYQGISADSKFIVKVFYKQDVADAIRFLSEKNKVKIKILRENSKYYFMSFS